MVFLSHGTEDVQELTIPCSQPLGLRISCSVSSQAFQI